MDEIGLDGSVRAETFFTERNGCTEVFAMVFSHYGRFVLGNLGELCVMWFNLVSRVMSCAGLALVRTL